MPGSATEVRIFLQRAERLRRSEIHARAGGFRAAVPALATLLVQRYGARKVWLFGSLAWGEPHARSDVDLAVEGLPAEQHFAAHGAVLLAAPGAVDLVRIEELEPSFADRIRREGRLVEVSDAT